MAYCTPTHVQEEFKSLDVSTGNVMTTAKVTRFIEESDAEMNSRLATRYSTPITGTEALIVARKISIGLTAARVKRILEIQGIEQPKEQAAKTNELIKEARDLLKALADGAAILTDATVRSSGQGFGSYNVDEDVEALYDAESEQW